MPSKFTDFPGSFLSPSVSPALRSVPLDFLRGVAVLLVLGFHRVIGPEQAGLFFLPSKILTRMGWIGVDLFFVLSGFLVGGLLFKELKRTGKLHMGRFLIRRGFKIWPSYYLFLAAGAVLLLLNPFDEAPHSLREIWPNLLHWQNYRRTPFGITWSLAVEEHFYLALPLFLVGLIRFETQPQRRLRLLPWGVVIVLLSCLTMRFISRNGSPDPRDHVMLTHLRMDSLMFGVMLAYLFHYHAAFWDRLAGRSFLFLAVGALLVLPSVFIRQTHTISVTIGFTLYYLGFGAILLACVGPQCVTQPPWRFWSWIPVRWVATMGLYSYTIYLWHNDFVRHFLIWIFKKPVFVLWPDTLLWLVANTAYLVLAALTGILMSKLVEGPFLKLRERLFPAFSTAPVLQEAKETSVPITVTS